MRPSENRAFRKVQRLEEDDCCYNSIVVEFGRVRCQYCRLWSMDSRVTGIWCLDATRAKRPASIPGGGRIVTISAGYFLSASSLCRAVFSSNGMSAPTTVLRLSSMYSLTLWALLYADQTRQVNFRG